MDPKHQKYIKEVDVLQIGTLYLRNMPQRYEQDEKKKENNQISKKLIQIPECSIS